MYNNIGNDTNTLKQRRSFYISSVSTKIFSTEILVEKIFRKSGNDTKNIFMLKKFYYIKGVFYMNIRDIARISGVGVSTVSRVLNNHPDVKESTRENVLRVIKESNYVPNNSARILKQNNTKNIGVLVKGVFNPFFSELINVIWNKIS